MGSIPVRVTKKRSSCKSRSFFFWRFLRNRKDGRAKRGKKQSGGLFFSPWEIPLTFRRSQYDCGWKSIFLYAEDGNRKTESDCLVDSQAPPVQKLVTHSTVTIPVRVTIYAVNDRFSAWGPNEKLKVENWKLRYAFGIMKIICEAYTTIFLF